MDIAPDVRDAVLARTDWLLCNAIEAEQLTGIADPERAGEVLFERWGRHGVVVRAGAQGCVAVTRDEVLQAPGFASDVLDTNGAGDVHNGVVLAELMCATPLAEALKRANAAAAIAISVFGPATCPVRQVVSDRLASESVVTTARAR
jgi:sugar/nucleoside kinase (ribokinase family)